MVLGGWCMFTLKSPAHNIKSGVCLLVSATVALKLSHDSRSCARLWPGSKYTLSAIAVVPDAHKSSPTYAISHCRPATRRLCSTTCSTDISAANPCCRIPFPGHASHCHCSFCSPSKAGWDAYAYLPSLCSCIRCSDECVSLIAFSIRLTVLVIEVKSTPPMPHGLFPALLLENPSILITSSACGRRLAGPVACMSEWPSSPEYLGLSGGLQPVAVVSRSVGRRCRCPADAGVIASAPA